jgi:lipopolysaccharide/colanic/teichoic acid biosynthesis glycosyltransferase
MLKRAIDVFVSTVVLLLLLPALLAIAALVSVCDGRPVFYRGIRIGRFGKPFRIFKFRTMVVDAERMGGSATADTDARITRIGRAPEYVALLSETEQLILTVRPGITDWATLWDADEGALLALTSDPERTYVNFILPEKVKLQLHYVRSQSLWTDLLILWKTAYAIIFKPTPPSFALLRGRSPTIPQEACTAADANNTTPTRSTRSPFRK